MLLHGWTVRPLRSDTLSKFFHALSWTRLEMATGDARKHEKCTLADEPRQGHGRMSGSSPRSQQMRHSPSAIAPRSFPLSTYSSKLHIIKNTAGALYSSNTRGIRLRHREFRCLRKFQQRAPHVGFLGVRVRAARGLPFLFASGLLRESPPRVLKMTCAPAIPNASVHTALSTEYRKQ